MDWTPEERAIIEQAIKDLTVKDAATVIKSELYKALGEGRLGQKNDENVRDAIKHSMERLLRTTLHTEDRDNFSVSVESHPDDPTKVVADIELTPIHPIVFEE